MRKAQNGNVERLKAQVGAALLEDTGEGTPQGQPERVVIKPLNLGTMHLKLKGRTPYVGNKLSAKNFKEIRAKQEQGSTAQSRSRKVRAPKVFEGLHLEHMHTSVEGWAGIPASSFRNAAIDACRVAGFKMTHAKMSIFVIGDGLDKDDGQPLVKIQGKVRPLEMNVRLADGSIDIAVRPQWLKWDVDLQVEWDKDQFTAGDIVNLFNRAGYQVGVGAGRPYSKASNGLGWGTFEIANV